MVPDFRFSKTQFVTFSNIYEGTKQYECTKMPIASTKIQSSTKVQKEIVYPELSYKIVGVLFEVFKQLGSGYREQYYQRALAEEFARSGLSFKEQVLGVLNYKGRPIGKCYIDFLIDGKVVLEIKKSGAFSKKNIDQVYSYLKALNLKLGILANFDKSGLKYRRIVNLV